MGSGERPHILNRAIQLTTQNYGVAGIVALIFLLIFIPWWIQWILLYIGGLIFVCTVIAPFIDDWRPRARVPLQGKAVFISGCDSGFGHMLAQRLDDLGLQVFAGCLHPGKEGAQTLKKSCSERLHVVYLNVLCPETIENAVQYVSENIQDNKFWALVNNAGLSGGGEISWTSPEIFEYVFGVNTFGIVRLTKAFLPLLIKDKGRVINVASAAGRYTYPGMVSYCMSKHATVSFSEGLRLEMYRFGVRVISIEPWMYKTPYIDRDKVLRDITKTWDESPDEIKELYPEDYIELRKRGIGKFVMSSLSGKPQEVVSCLEEAILAFDPKFVYNPGSVIARLFYWILCRLPKPMADGMLYDQYEIKDRK